MAKAKNQANTIAATKETTEEVTSSVETNVEEMVLPMEESSVQASSYNDLLAMVANLQKQVADLAANNFTKVEPTPVVNRVEESSNDATAKLVEILANKKSEKEITIVHNCEVLGGTSTHIELTGMTIDFHIQGEERLLSWQQFEELVSRYRSFFERRIIILGAGQDELAERYGVPCIKTTNTHVVTRDELTNLHKLSPRKLEEYIVSLSDEDKRLVASFWIGNCYERKDGYYDRGKVELLNRLLEDHPFENILTLMNGDYRVIPEKGESNNLITSAPVG